MKSSAWILSRPPLDTTARAWCLLLERGARVVAIDADGADVLTGQGSKQRFYRNVKASAEGAQLASRSETLEHKGVGLMRCFGVPPLTKTRF
jgi:hypothetical protein